VAWSARRDDDADEPRRYRFTGMEQDETGLQYHSARYYAPWLGRWTSPDPVEARDGHSRYSYCFDNPVLHEDRNGRWPNRGPSLEVGQLSLEAGLQQPLLRPGELPEVPAEIAAVAVAPAAAGLILMQGTNRQAPQDHLPGHYQVVYTNTLRAGLEGETLDDPRTILINRSLTGARLVNTLVHESLHAAINEDPELRARILHALGVNSRTTESASDILESRIEQSINRAAQAFQSVSRQRGNQGGASVAGLSDDARQELSRISGRFDEIFERTVLEIAVRVMAEEVAPEGGSFVGLDAPSIHTGRGTLQWGAYDAYRRRWEGIAGTYGPDFVESVSPYLAEYLRATEQTSSAFSGFVRAATELFVPSVPRPGKSPLDEFRSQTHELFAP